MVLDNGLSTRGSGLGCQEEHRNYLLAWGGGEAWLFLKLSLVGRLNKSAGGGQSVERAGSRASVATVAFKIWSHLGSLSPRRTNMEKEGNQAL